MVAERRAREQAPIDPEGKMRTIEHSITYGIEHNELAIQDNLDTYYYNRERIPNGADNYKTRPTGYYKDVPHVEAAAAPNRRCRIFRSCSLTR